MTDPRSSELLTNLTDEQRQAVLATDGPVLILAGAGSGKTRVITHRIAYLVSSGRASLGEILALTFTNKAAREMRERVLRILDPTGEHGLSPSGLWVTTFHSFGSRFMRLHAQELGYDPSYVIYDQDDTARVVKRIFKEKNLVQQRVLPSNFISWLDSSRCDQLELTGSLPEQTFLERRFVEIHAAYREELKKHNAMDFRDLLLRPLEVLTRFPEVKRRYQEKFKYVLIDEYQDTNRVQYMLAKALSGARGNICAVGDEDQSIYSWRGATIQNIMDFEKDFGETVRVFHLLENYRSPESILTAANNVIKHNTMTHRKERPLVAKKGKGQPVSIFPARDGEEEAGFVCKSINELRGRGVPLSDIAVFYRTHAQSRLIEQRLAQERIPYQVFGGTPFFSRKEIKDLLAYLWVVTNPKDPVNLERALMTPRRGVGETSIEKSSSIAREKGLTLFDALRAGEGLSAAARRKLDGFFSLIDELAALSASSPLFDLAVLLVDRIGYREHLALEGREDREEIVDEFLSHLADFDRHQRPHLSPSGPPPLVTFLEGVSLAASLDRFADESGMVTLMTVHNAKGLEFPYVLLTGLEEKLFPHASSYEDAHQLEEERRLFYVGMTRTQKELTLSWARRRTIRGTFQEQLPSRFLSEIGRDHFRMVGRSLPPPTRFRPQTIDPIYED